MRTVSYQSVLEGVLRRVGQQPATAAAETLAQAAEFIADRYRDAVEFYRWPDFLRTELRRFRDTWAAGTYAAGAEVWHAPTAAYWTAPAGATAGEVPGTAAEWVALTGNWHRYVPYEQAGQLAIGAVFAAHTVDPRADPAALRVSFRVTDEGITIPPASGALDGVWLTYRLREEDYAWSSVYSASATYAPGQLIYFAPEVWECVTATSAGESPTSAAAKWRQLEFPHRLARAVKAGARADLLGAQGQEEKEGAREPAFEDLLDEQVTQLVTLQGQTGRPSTIPPP
jgi:hypothetical protein